MQSRGSFPPRTDLRIWRLHTAGQLAWPSRADRQLRPGHQISFGNLDYVADIRGDLIFQGITPPTSALALDPERIARSKDGLSELAGLFATIRPIVEEPEEVSGEWSSFVMVASDATSTVSPVLGLVAADSPAGSRSPSSDMAMHSGSKAGAGVGVMNPWKIKSPRTSAT